MSWRNARRSVSKPVVIGLVVVGAALTAFDLFYKKKVYFEVEYLFGFYALAGFAVCIALVLVAWVVRALLGRREDFYAPADTTSEAHPAFDLDVSPAYQEQAGERVDV